jgi:hypothetical protein
MEFNKPLSGDDFFAQTFGVETATTEEEKTPELKEPSNIIKAIIESGDDDTEEDADSEDLQPNKGQKIEQALEEEEDSTSEESIYEQAAQILNKKGFIADELPAGVENLNSVEDFVAVLEHNLKLREEEILENVYNDLDERLSPFARQILDFDLESKKSGGDIVDFAKSILYTVEISEYDTEDIEDQIEINRQYYLATGVKPEKVDKIIASLKDNPEKLKEEAIENKPELVELSRKEAMKQIEAQAIIKEREEQMHNVLAKKLADQLGTLKIGSIGEGLDEYPILADQAQKLYKSLIGEKYEVSINGKKVEMSKLEALADFHRYNPKGNINRLLTAMLIMEDPKIVFNHFTKSATTKVAKEAKSQNNFGNNTGLVFNKKVNKTEAKKEGFDIFKQAL